MVTEAGVRHGEVLVGRATVDITAIGTAGDTDLWVPLTLAGAGAGKVLLGFHSRLISERLGERLKAASQQLALARAAARDTPSPPPQPEATARAEAAAHALRQQVAQLQQELLLAQQQPPARGAPGKSQIVVASDAVYVTEGGDGGPKGDLRGLQKVLKEFLDVNAGADLLHVRCDALQAALVPGGARAADVAAAAGKLEASAARALALLRGGLTMVKWADHSVVCTLLSTLCGALQEMSSAEQKLRLLLPIAQEGALQERQGAKVRFGTR